MVGLEHMTISPANADQLIETTSPSKGVKNFAQFCTLLLALSCLLRAAGWVLNIEVLRNPFPHLATGTINSSLGLLLIAIVLCLIHFHRNRPAWWVWVASVVVGIFGTATLFEYLVHVDLEIDRLIFHDMLASSGTTNPGRMSLNTAICFMLVACSAVCVTSSKKRVIQLGQCLAILLWALSDIAILGYTYGFAMLYQVNANFAQQPLTVSILFWLCSISLFLARLDISPAQLIASSGSGGAICRQLMPLSLGAPFLGMLSGLQTHNDMDLLILIILVGFGFPIAVYVTAKKLQKSEVEQTKLNIALQQRAIELQAINKELERTTNELVRSNSDLQQFAYICSHDLQEPLRVVSNFSQLLANRYKGQFDEKADQFIEFIVDGSKRMQNLINDLLTYSRVQTKEQVLLEVDCSHTVAMALANLQLAIEENAATIHYEALPTIDGDASQLLQLFQNLLGNALKFRSKESPNIRITADKCDSSWQFAISDNGIGLDMQFAERVFLIFQRLHSREMYPGSGIGLAICKKIVQRHGGCIWVESELGKGTTFYFTMPVKTSRNEYPPKQ
jgi:signal transduction histidine kinase